MKTPWYKFGILTIALATLVSLTTPAQSFAQRGGGGGRGGGHGQGGGGGQGRGGGGGGGGRGHAQSHDGGNRGGGPNWNQGRDGGRQASGDWRYYSGGGNRGYYRGGPQNLNQFYRGYYNSGYRGNYYGSPGFGPTYGRYGYGSFPWYVGLATYGLNFNRGYGYGYGNGYVSGQPVIVERYSETTTPTAPAVDDFVPQLNRTKTVLGAQPSGAALLGITMDPQYAEAAVVRQVSPGTAAEQAGLRPGDMIASIDRTQIRNPADVTNYVAAKQAGEQIEMEFVRPIRRSEVKAAAPEEGLGVPAPAASAPAATVGPTEAIPPPVPQPPVAN
jgi:hypothetical protein